MIQGTKLIRSLPVVIALGLFAITIFSWNQTQRASSQANQDYFDFRVREAISHIENRMATYQQVLHGARGLYEASVEVTRTEFRDYVFSLHLADNFPGNQGVGFSRIIPADQKEAHLSAVRKEGFPEYNILPEGERDPFTSIVFLEPLADRNLRAFGYDMFSEPVRREAMERSRDSDKPAMSGKVRLVQEDGKKEQAGFLIYIPVYDNHFPHDTLSNRQANILGWVYSPFRMNDLMEGIFGEYAQDIDVEIYDGDQIDAESLMYDSNDSNDPNSIYLPATHSNVEDVLISNQTINIAGHTWTILILALPSLYTRVDADESLPTLMIGTMASLLFGWLARLLITGRERALKIATQMNRQYIESETTLQAILDSSAIGVAWANRDGKIEYVNSKFTSMFGYTLKDVPTEEQWYIRAYPDTKYRRKIIALWDSMVEETMQDGSHLSPMESEITCQDGSVKQVLLLGSWAGSKLVVNFTDITERKKSEALAEYKTNHDFLTGLANRALFSEHLDQAINMAKRESYQLAVLFIDLDNFKHVNDKFGHSVGDALLKEVAARIKECLRESDLVSRMAGDEFLVLLREIEKNDVALVADKIRFVLGHPFIINGQSINSRHSAPIIFNFRNNT
ncbi:MAG: hypothetical protein AUJ56_11045 [Zetaproteobacteria bacterium CG1_02_49_23]|nr:MAG: hypothetical protein AUJ56_11045 [Zetaproteobacteria bacterium CG1_02_49_23]